jgi:hypothetical protein
LLDWLEICENRDIDRNLVSAVLAGDAYRSSVLGSGKPSLV